MKEIIERYYELNKNRSLEEIDEWAERMRLHKTICKRLFRDLRETGRKEECVFCGGSIQEDETYAHSSCLEKQITYRKGVELNSQAFVYCLYRFGCLIYVGIAQSPRSRFRSHVMEKDVWQMEVIFGGSRREVEELEKKYIHRFYPPLNKRLHDATGKQLLASDMAAKVVGYEEVMQFVRNRDQEFDDMLRSLWEKVRAMQIQMNAYEDRMNFLESVAFRPAEEDCW